MVEVSKDGLLPCPFCGGQASDAGHVRYSKPLPDTWWADGSLVTEAFFVNCIACGAASRSGLSNGYQTKAEAVTAWNTRAPSTLQAERDRYRVALEEIDRGPALKFGAGGIEWNPRTPIQIARTALSDTPTVQSDEWIEWTGGEPPVGPTAIVDYRLRCGEVTTAFMSCDCDWWHRPDESGSDIIAYRLVSK